MFVEAQKKGEKRRKLKKKGCGKKKPKLDTKTTVYIFFFERMVNNATLDKLLDVYIEHANRQIAVAFSDPTTPYSLLRILLLSRIYATKLRDIFLDNYTDAQDTAKIVVEHLKEVQNIPLMTLPKSSPLLQNVAKEHVKLLQQYAQAAAKGLPQSITPAAVKVTKTEFLKLAVEKEAADEMRNAKKIQQSIVSKPNLKVEHSITETAQPPPAKQELKVEHSAEKALQPERESKKTHEQELIMEKALQTKQESETVNTALEAQRLEDARKIIAQHKNIEECLAQFGPDSNVSVKQSSIRNDTCLSAETNLQTNDIHARFEAMASDVTHPLLLNIRAKVIEAYKNLLTTEKNMQTYESMVHSLTKENMDAIFEIATKAKNETDILKHWHASYERAQKLVDAIPKFPDESCVPPDFNTTYDQLFSSQLAYREKCLQICKENGQCTAELKPSVVEFFKTTTALFEKSKPHIDDMFRILTSIESDMKHNVQLQLQANDELSFISLVSKYQQLLEQREKQLEKLKTLVRKTDIDRLLLALKSSSQYRDGFSNVCAGILWEQNFNLNPSLIRTCWEQKTIPNTQAANDLINSRTLRTVNIEYSSKINMELTKLEKMFKKLDESINQQPNIDQNVDLEKFAHGMQTILTNRDRLGLQIDFYRALSHIANVSIKEHKKQPVCIRIQDNELQKECEEDQKCDIETESQVCRFFGLLAEHADPLSGSNTQVEDFYRLQQSVLAQYPELHQQGRDIALNAPTSPLTYDVVQNFRQSVLDFVDNVHKLSQIEKKINEDFKTRFYARAMQLANMIPNLKHVDINSRAPQTKKEEFEAAKQQVKAIQMSIDTEVKSIDESATAKNTDDVLNHLITLHKLVVNRDQLYEHLQKQASDIDQWLVTDTSCDSIKPFNNLPNLNDSVIKMCKSIIINRKSDDDETFWNDRTELNALIEKYREYPDVDADNGLFVVQQFSQFASNFISIKNGATSYISCINALDVQCAILHQTPLHANIVEDLPNGKPNFLKDFVRHMNALVNVLNNLNVILFAAQLEIQIGDKNQTCSRTLRKQLQTILTNFGFSSLATALSPCELENIRTLTRKLVTHYRTKKMAINRNIRKELKSADANTLYDLLSHVNEFKQNMQKFGVKNVPDEALDNYVKLAKRIVIIRKSGQNIGHDLELRIHEFINDEQATEPDFESFFKLFPKDQDFNKSSK